MIEKKEENNRQKFVADIFMSSAVKQGKMYRVILNIQNPAPDMTSNLISVQSRKA